MCIEKIAIIGGQGAMGSLYTQRLRKIGCKVKRPLHGVKFEQTLGEAQLVILAVPATAITTVLTQTVPYLNGAILSDLTSVKIEPMRWMKAHYAGPIIGTHPLFGPDIPEKFIPKVCITPDATTDPRPLKNLLKKIGFMPFVSSAQEHDKSMAFIQGLNFISTVAHLAAMRQMENIEQFLTPSFERRLNSAQKMLTTDQKLFETISENNPLLQETVRQYTSFLNIAAGGDLNLLAERARWWWNKARE